MMAPLLLRFQIKLHCSRSEYRASSARCFDASLWLIEDLNEKLVWRYRRSLVSMGSRMGSRSWRVSSKGVKAKIIINTTEQTLAKLLSTHDSSSECRQR
jgi:hypothetical protein